MKVNLDNNYEILKLLFDMLPFVFWKDKSGVYRGANQNQAEEFGFNSPSEFIGKTIFEIIEDEFSALSIHNIDKMIMETGIARTVEEPIMTPFGERVYLSQKHPIRNANNIIVGLIGISMDITAIRKEEKAREQFKKFVEQISHDLFSPLLALKFHLDSLKIDEIERHAIRESSQRIFDIASYLLAGDMKHTEEEQPIAMLVKPAIDSLLRGKKYEYKRAHVSFELRCNEKNHNLFISMRPIAFERMISNLINNAVEALGGKSHRFIFIKLMVNNKNDVCIRVEDNGRGIPQNVLEKLKRNIKVSCGKASGHGIGFGQILDTVNENNGTINIYSEEDFGTRISLSFPKISAPEWYTNSINIYFNTIIVILEDDELIHDTWEQILSQTIKVNPDITVRHIFSGADALEYIKILNNNQKENLVLLSDYQLIKQEYNGLEIAINAKVKNTYIVTSFYNNYKIQNEAIINKFKIIPKPILDDIIINYLI